LRTFSTANSQVICKENFLKNKTPQLLTVEAQIKYKSRVATLAGVETG
jgi:hypothetical protein